MLLNKIAAFANIGTFILGALTFWYMLKSSRTIKAEAVSTKKSMSNPDVLIYFFLAIMLIAGYLNFEAARIQWNRPSLLDSTKPLSISESQEIPSISEQRRQKERVFVPPSATPEFLEKMTLGHTDVQAEDITSGYRGKWIKISGQVIDVRSTPEGYWVSVYQKNSPHTSVGAKFVKSDSDRLSVLMRGDTVTASCQIYDIESLGVDLHHCELPTQKSK